MTRNGSITLGLLNGSITLGLLIGFTLGGLAVGGGAGWWLTGKARDAKALEAAHAHQVEQDALQGRVEALVADLGECRARVTAESIGAALAPELADAQARADILANLPRAKVAEAVIEHASPRLLVATDWMMRCESLLMVNNVDRLGCGSKGEAVQALQDALEAQAACPEPTTDP